jgi:hypothetical protein
MTGTRARTHCLRGARIAFTIFAVIGLLFTGAPVATASPAAATPTVAAPTGTPTAMPAQRQTVGDYPLKRRRHLHLWNNRFWHSGIGHFFGALGWILLAPFLILAVLLVALPLWLRARRRRSRRF